MRVVKQDDVNSDARRGRSTGSRRLGDDPDLARLIEAWPELSGEIRGRILDAAGIER